MEYQVHGFDVLIISILVLYLGTFLTHKLHILRDYNIPAAVTGGILCSGLIASLFFLGGLEITFDMTLRDTLLLVFFSTIGLSAKLRLLWEGGKALAILLLVATIFLVIQDCTGVLLVKLLGAHPGYGLFGGSVSFAGGHGTAIAWGQVAEEAGLTRAKEIGIACATFGLIAGGLIGGPIAKLLIKKHRLESKATDQSTSGNSGKNHLPYVPIKMSEILGSILLLAVCVEVGALVNRLLFAKGVMLPGFLTSMMVGILLTNGADLCKIKLSKPAIDQWNEVSLQLFLSMSLMSMQLWTLVEAMGPILLVLTAQITVMTFFSIFVVFKVMGSDYDASVIAAGFSGLGLGATPVGIANMNAITSKYGPSPKAFLVIPLIGAFFIDLVNVLVIKFFVALPMMQAAPS